MNYAKQALSYPALIVHLQKRGLIIENTAEAEAALKFFGYYRLRAYMLPLRSLVPGNPHRTFRQGTTLQDVLNLYEFDRKLRLLTMDAIERIEVAIRSVIIHEMSIRHGPHWFLDPAHFVPPKAPPGVRPKFVHADFIQRIEQDLRVKPGGGLFRPHDETFINHYFKKYTKPYLPPVWMVAETMTLGSWSLVLDHLAGTRERKAIAAPFEILQEVLRSWLQSLAYLQNLCAHHARVWNRSMTIKPERFAKLAAFPASNDRYYALAVVINHLLKHITPKSRWSARLAVLLEDHHFINAAAMGFPADWKSDPFWELSAPEYEI